MLTQITVQGFKSLQDVQVELGQINVFMGANGSGKTSLLEAIGLLSAAASGLLDDQALLRRGVRPGTPLLYKSSFKTAETPESVRIRATWLLEQARAKYQITLDDITDTARQFWLCDEKYFFNDQEQENDSQTTTAMHIRSNSDVGKNKNTDPTPQWMFRWGERRIPSQFEPLLFSISDYSIFSPTTPILQGTAIDITQRPPVGLAGGQLAEAVNELLDVKKRKFGTLDLDELFELLDWVEEIAVVPPPREIVSPSVPTTRSIIRFTDRWMDKNRNQLSAYDASEGALYVLFALVLALHPRSPRLFAIENLDQAMHPRLARATTRLFCQQMLQSSPERQALLTTHNPLVLDGLDLRDERIRLFAVERNARGATQVYRVQVSDEVLKATQQGLSLSNLWVMGRLGGVPDLF